MRNTGQIRNERNIHPRLVININDMHPNSPTCSIVSLCAVMEQRQQQQKQHQLNNLQMAHQQRGTDRPVDDVQQRRV